MICFSEDYARLIPKTWRVVVGMRGREAARLLRLQGTRATLVGARVVDCRVCVAAAVWTGDTAGWSAGGGVSVQGDMQSDTDKCSSDSVRKARVCQWRQAQAGATQASKRCNYNFICRQRSGVGGVGDDITEEETPV